MAAKESPAPAGKNVVVPYLIVDDVEKQIDFFKKVFNAEDVDIVKQPDGAIMHAEIKIGNSSIMMGRANQNYPAVQNMNYIYVKNADEYYKKALENGATSLMEPDDRFYGIREGGIKDPNGNTWWIGQFIRKVSQSEIEQKIAEMMQENK